MAEFDYKEYARQMRENAVKDHNGNIICSSELWEQIASIIENTPAADVVEVVRCQKCKHGDVSIHSLSKDGEEEIACYCNLKNRVTDVDSYCPSGERKDT